MKAKDFLLFLAALFFFGAGTFAQTQSAMNEEACNKLKRADAVLNRIYEQVLTSKATDVDFVKAFLEAYSTWISFRNAHVKSVYPDPEPWGGVWQCVSDVPMRSSGADDDSAHEPTTAIVGRWDR